MERISNLLNIASLSVKKEEVKTNTALDPHVTAVVNELFVFFCGICKGFNKQYQDPKKLNVEKTQWIRAFMYVGINSLDKIERGCNKCLLEPDLINTPTIGQFIKWCTPTPEELEIPSVEHAYDEACKNSRYSEDEKTWSHPAVYHAWLLCNTFELCNLPKSSTFPSFQKNYELIIGKLIKGETLEIPKALTSDRDSAHKHEVPEEFKGYTRKDAAMEAIRNMLGMQVRK